MGRPSRWRAAAEAAIRAAIAEARALDLSEAELIRRVDAAYPFGERLAFHYRLPKVA